MSVIANSAPAACLLVQHLDVGVEGVRSPGWPPGWAATPTENRPAASSTSSLA